jgi:hypothetical protein
VNGGKCFSILYVIRTISFCLFSVSKICLNSILSKITAAEFDWLLLLHLGISMVNFYIDVVVFEIYQGSTSDGFVCVINAVIALTAVL